MSGSQYERNLLNILEEEYGWLGVRAAGSMGKGDIVAINPDHDNSPIVIEVKKTSKDTFRTSSGASGAVKEQFFMMVDHASRGIQSCYALRFTRGDKETRWQIYWVDGNEEDPAIFRRGEGDTLDETFA